MPWMRVDASVRENPKIERAARRLAIAPAHMGGHMLWLWLWALRYAADGDLRGRDNEQVAIMAQWPGDADQFVNALVSCGLLDRDESTGSLRVHDWMEYADQYKEAHKKAKQRAKIEDEGTSPGQSEKVPPRRRRGRKTKTDLPEREERAHEPCDASEESHATASTEPVRASVATPPAEVEGEPAAAPQAAPCGSGAALLPPAMAEAPIDPDDEPLDDTFGPDAAIEAYREHVHPALAPPPVKGDKGYTSLRAEVLRTIRDERMAAHEARRRGEPPPGENLRTRRGWVEIAQRTHAARYLHPPTPADDGPWIGSPVSMLFWVKGGRGADLGAQHVAKLFEGGYDQRHQRGSGNRNTTQVRSLVESAHRMREERERREREKRGVEEQGAS